MSDVLLLSRAHVSALMAPSDYLAAVERAFRASKQGGAASAPPMHLPANPGGFHAKGAVLHAERTYVALKLNGNFPGNPERSGLPTIQGAILLCDGDTGAVLAILDSIEITLRRTAAASALAAKHLVRPNAETIAMCGCGGQARAQLEALFDVIPFERGFAWDLDAGKARALAAEMSAILKRPIAAVDTLREATLPADVIVTCTTARAPFLTQGDVKPGAFVAAVGADNPDKNEIAPALMASSVVVVDAIDQCRHMGDLHHAIGAGLITEEGVRAELADIVVGARAGRLHNDEVIIFDSTGTALQDVASAALAFERACGRGVGVPFKLA